MLIGGHAQADIQALEKQQWVEVSTENFRIVTDHKEKKAIKIALNLERFRHAYARLYGSALPSSEMPLKVIAPRKSATFQLLAGDEDRLQSTIGFFINNNSGNYATVEATRILSTNSSRQQTSLSSLFHEYVHYLTASLYSAHLPYWYSEGFAEYLSSIRFKKDDTVILGLPLRYHIESIANSQWMPIEQVLKATHFEIEQDNDIQRLYSQGWLAVHYFNQDSEKKQDLMNYLTLLTEGVSIDEAVARGLKRSYAQLDEELRRYARKGRWPYSKFNLATPLATDDISSRALNSSQLLFEFGEFFHNGMKRHRQAERFFQRSLELQAANGEALAGLASLALSEDLALAEQLINRSLIYSSGNQWVNTVAGHIYAKKLEAAESEEDKAALRDKTLRFYDSAIQAGSRNVEAISAAANLYYTERNFDKARELLEMAYGLAPASAQVKVDLIRVYYALGEFEAGDAFADLERRNNHKPAPEMQAFEEWVAAARKEAKRYYNAIKLAQ